jgi:hypothetical protein
MKTEYLSLSSVVYLLQPPDWKDDVKLCGYLDSILEFPHESLRKVWYFSEI